ncbi:MAG: UDP binding domain-containing protein, partial [Actinomycetota bacterium]
RGASVSYHDPYVETLDLGGVPCGRTELTHHVLEAADCVAILTPHSTYDLNWIADHARLIFDGRNAFGDDRRPEVVRL